MILKFAFSIKANTNSSLVPAYNIEQSIAMKREVLSIFDTFMKCKFDPMNNESNRGRYHQQNFNYKTIYKIGVK